MIFIRAGHGDLKETGYFCPEDSAESYLPFSVHAEAREMYLEDSSISEIEEFFNNNYYGDDFHLSMWEGGFEEEKEDVEEAEEVRPVRRRNRIAGRGDRARKTQSASPSEPAD